MHSSSAKRRISQLQLEQHPSRGTLSNDDPLEQSEIVKIPKYDSGARPSTTNGIRTGKGEGEMRVSEL
jgi:hypothetical protein